MLVGLPNGIKPLGCKWVCKRKRKIYEKVETFKAKLVAKSYTHKEGIDYEETFSPIVMIKFICILLSITTILDYEIWQMDIRTTFLNRNLDKSIYMMQQEGFVWKTGIYGLKQAFRS